MFCFVYLQLRAQYAEYLAGLRERICEVMEELIELLDLCHASEDERAALPSLDEGGGGCPLKKKSVLYLVIN